MTNPAPRPPLPLPLRALRQLLGWALALIILFEEWGWEPLRRALQRLERWPPLQRLAAAIGRLPPHAALAVLAVPAIALLPVKLGALWLLGRGHAVLGLGLVLLAKLAGTAVVARLFELTRPALMQLPWLARAYGRWTTWKDALLATVRASRPWRVARAVKRRLWARWKRQAGAPHAG